MLSAAGGADLGSTLFYGSEFGGQRRPKVRVAVIKQSGGFVERRTTMQFRPHIGKGRWYWFHPTLRRNTSRIWDGILQIVVEESGVADIDRRLAA